LIYFAWDAIAKIVAADEGKLKEDAVVQQKDEKGKPNKKIGDVIEREEVKKVGKIESPKKAIDNEDVFFKSELK